MCTSAEPSKTRRGASRRCRDPLFGHMNPFPQMQIMTFHKHRADFTLFVDYTDLDFLGKEVDNPKSHLCAGQGGN